MQTYKESLKKALFILLLFFFAAVPAIFRQSDLQAPEFPLKELVAEKKVTAPAKEAVLIPQTHKYPGSKASDSVNDQAQAMQQKIYDILSSLSPKTFVMVEGELYGEVAKEKIEKLSSLMSLRDNFKTVSEKLLQILDQEGASPEELKKLSQDCKEFLAALDREVILSGAAHVLKAEGGNFKLIGSENETTQKESAEIVRNYIYLKDRKEQLAGSKPLALSEKFGSLNSLLGSLGEKDDIAIDIKIVSSYASTCPNPELKKVSSELSSIYNSIKNLQEKPVSSSAPKRIENPFGKITSVQKINSLLRETEEQINQVVIEKRNKEAAENFVRTLEEQGVSSGIIQYGSGHEEGLVKELESLGVSAKVIKP